MKVYDAENQILGRLCTKIAKDLLNEEQVVVINAEKAVLSGNPVSKTAFYLKRIQRGDPGKGPFFPKYPDDIFRRTVRGMLPWNRTRGRKAYRKLKVYIGTPEEFKNRPKEKLEIADASKLKTTYIHLGEISTNIGAKKRW